MKNNNVLNFRELHNCGIDSKNRTYLANFDFISQILLDEFSDSSRHSYKFSGIGFDYDNNNIIRQVQCMEGYDIFEVLREAYHNEDKYGKHFCILHHDLFGFHFICY